MFLSPVGKMVLQAGLLALDPSMHAPSQLPSGILRLAPHYSSGTAPEFHRSSLLSDELVHHTRYIFQFYYSTLK